VDLDAAVLLVAHDRWFLEAVGTAVLELYGSHPAQSRFFAGSWHQWRREQARARSRWARRSTHRSGDRAHGALHRALPLQGEQGKQAQSRVKKLAKIDRIERDPRDDRNLEFEFSAPERSGRVIFELSDGRVEIAEAKAARWCCSTTPSCGWSVASTCRWWAQRDRQDDADRDARGRRELARAS